MMTETGVVVATQDNALIVEVLKTSACQSCKAKQGCGQAVLAEWGDTERQQQKNHFQLPYSGPANVGDVVELGMAADTVSRVAMLVYMVPLFFAFLGLFVANQVGLHEGFQVLVMALSFVAGYVLISQFPTKKMSALEPQILRLSSPGKASDLIASSATEKV
ncbi:SoxR reducing system RseC family protein [Reinekea sp. G2M2-21]|uniref:SoxR reducing system RseC family protein n=1 Tax=Reinekea sp. G2M2-21 TaxID=2788942 RepID=UPI0018A95335|nr:SoxR reducing system RseC family protein [Reinekea sp. G2M2-21]